MRAFAGVALRAGNHAAFRLIRAAYSSISVAFNRGSRRSMPVSSCCCCGTICLRCPILAVFSKTPPPNHLRPPFRLLNACLFIPCPISHRDSKLAPFMPEVHPDAVLILEDDAKLEPGYVRLSSRIVFHYVGTNSKRVGFERTGIRFTSWTTYIQFHKDCPFEMLPQSKGMVQEIYLCFFVALVATE